MNAQKATENAHGMSLFTFDRNTDWHSVRTSQVKEIQTIKMQISENKEHFSQLMSSAEPDMNAIYLNIGELETLHNQLSKSRLRLIKICALGLFHPKA